MSREGLLKKADEKIDIRNIVARISFRQILDLRKVVSRLKEPYKAYQKTLTKDINNTGTYRIG